ncbi:septum formation inhibitor Maf [Corynebacterium sp. 320]|uniref:Maf family protein n=1 Tax=Corynebacterium TaxID=1716 RepID=UPI00125CCB22|nr:MULTISPECIES: nucleoside triphosphate pyrophosphatase [Corynebacterium]KAB1504199.1 septum formation inhibitor Maf [Corynebacterium sp. 320]KAB1552701.1 septum formation inhibitor Maf [Corynebacterium sp. 321]KAB1554081.1 septum formation inhibitor Maf [Corynebacterium sp. 319]KAB3528335.1 septum formation inhibitor Maf [Corynebacterium sp. 250]KAB3540176.1 septum formation inhibitor Maf [Corynebacterium sp. 366]
MAGTSPRLVLASTSASRLSILRSAGVEPEVAPSGVDEDAVVAALHNPSPEDVVRALATAKARSVAQTYEAEELPEGLVIVGADSMLLIDGELQGKPHTEEETIRRWRNQRGRTAELITGHAMMAESVVFTEVSRTRIQFAQATDEDIAAYAATGEPFGCAGAFTLEALGGWFIDRIEGDPSSVIGLSLPVLRRGLTVFGYNVSQFWNR